MIESRSRLAPPRPLDMNSKSDEDLKGKETKSKSSSSSSSFSCGNTSYESNDSEEEKNVPKVKTVLTFDAYGNLTSSDDADAPSGYDMSFPAEFNGILGNLQDSPPKDILLEKYSSVKNSFSKQNKAKWTKNDSGTGEASSFSDSDLKQAFKTEFSITATSRYGRTRKQKAPEDGFLFGTFNFNELRKITGTSPKKHKLGTDSRIDSEANSDKDLSADLLNQIQSVSGSFSEYSSEDEFQTPKATVDLQNQNMPKRKKNELLPSSSQSTKVSLPSVKAKSSKSKSDKNKKYVSNESQKRKRKVEDNSRTTGKRSHRNKTPNSEEPEKKNENKSFKVLDTSNISNCSSHTLEAESNEKLLDTINPENTQKKATRGSLRKNELNEMNSIEEDVNIIKSSLARSVTRHASINELSVVADLVNYEEINKSPAELTFGDLLKQNSDFQNSLFKENDLTTMERSNGANTEQQDIIGNTCVMTNGEKVIQSTEENVSFTKEYSVTEIGETSNVSSIVDGDKRCMTKSEERTVTNIDESNILKKDTLVEEIKAEEIPTTTKSGRQVRKPDVIDIGGDEKLKKANKIKQEQVKEEDLTDQSEANRLEKEVPCQFYIGDLVWVNVKGSPLWPALVCYPKNESKYTRIGGKSGGHKSAIRLRMYHVQFFCDNDQTIWISSNYVIPFEGLPKLISYIENQKAKFKKEPKINNQKNFLNTLNAMNKKQNSTKMERWYKAVKETEGALSLERYERIQKWVPFEKISDSEKKGDITPVASRKRKHSKVGTEKTLTTENNNEGSGSKIKSEVGTESKLKLTEVTNGKMKASAMKPIKVKNKSSESEFSGFEESSYSSSEKRKRKKLKLEKITQGDFDIYAQKYLETHLEENPELSKDEAKLQLLARWQKLTITQKLRYKSKFVSDGGKKSALQDTEESGSDSSSLASSRSKRSCMDDDEEEEDSDVVRGTYRIPKNEKVCSFCESVTLKSGADMVKCKGVCNGSFHLHCVGLSTPPATEFKCAACLSGVHSCFICKSIEGDRNRCSVPYCGKFYHEQCVRQWPQVCKGRQSEKLICPRHVCQMCAANADDMSDQAARTPPFTRCLRCPTTYHTGDICIAAGVEEISQSHHICTKHMKASKNNSHHYNVNWCFCCSKGGSLLLCDQCPAAFHAECMNITTPEGSYVCEDCENGKFPVYGDIVWVKLGSYRWWPGQVLHPKYIPDNIENLAHEQGMFCVHFFGSNDYYWVSRGRTFHYQEGDQGSKSSSSKLVEQKFQKALDQAVVAYRKQKEKRDKQEQSRSLKGKLKPPPYVRIDTNKPVGSVKLGKLDPSTVTKCDCDPFSENPCGSDDKCINRMLMVECVREICSAKERCCNQRFQRRQYPNVFPFKTSARGWGLKTKDFIKKGDFVIEYVGELIDDAEFRRRIEEMHDYKEENYYFLTVNTDRLIDAGPKGNFARFMNHSCHPNCETQKWTVGAETRVGLFALEDIPEGSELTFNYNLECVGTEKKKCQCGAANCSGFIGAKVQKSEPIFTKKSRLRNGEKKKKRKKAKGKETENECFRCGYVGDLILCDMTMCPKGYHLECLGLDSLPKGKWLCPWHHCDECGSRSSNRCIMCPNSYCRYHSSGKFHPTPGLGNVCLEHGAEVLETLRVQTEAALDQKLLLEEIAPALKSQPEIMKDNPEINFASSSTSTNILGRPNNGKAQKLSIPAKAELPQNSGTYCQKLRNTDMCYLSFTKNKRTSRNSLKCDYSFTSNKRTTPRRVLRTVNNTQVVKNNPDFVGNPNKACIKRSRKRKRKMKTNESVQSTTHPEEDCKENSSQVGVPKT